MTSPRISRSNSPAPRESRGRTDSPKRRPGIERRDSSPMTKLATFGLLATSGIGQALGAPIMSRDSSPAPQRFMSRLEQDMAQAMNLVRREADGMADVDWSKVDYSGVDYSHVDWNKINYDRGDIRGDVPSTPGSPSVYGTPPALPSPTLSSLGRAYESTFGEPSPLPTPPAPPKSIMRGFSPTLPPIMTATPVPQGASATAQTTTQAPVPTTAPAIVVSPPANQAPLLAPSASNINFFSGVDVAQNAVAVAWHGEGEMTFSFFANAGPYQPNLSEAYKSVTLQPGSNEVVQLPHAWSGRVQKMTGAIDSDATWCELTFNGWNDLSWFDVSAIRGYNGPATMYLSDAPDQKAGSAEDRLKLFPNDKQINQPRGSAIPATEGYDGSIRFDVIDFWRANEHDTAAHKELYVRHDDDSATFTGSNKHLVVEWF